MSIAEQLTRRVMIGGAAAAIFAGAKSALAGRLDPLASTHDQQVEAMKPKQIGIVLFDEFETLDVFGPVQMWGRLADHGLTFVSADGCPVQSSHGVRITPDHSFASAPPLDVLMVPGGAGTRRLVDDAALLAFVRRQDEGSSWTTSVCTGAAILAKAGVLDGRAATTNKLAFEWVGSQSDAVTWRSRARWVVDGKYVTSSGVSAGTDMALALVERLYNRTAARAAAAVAEYHWNDDPQSDPFAVRPLKGG
jgi:putative intracellular protease/amidase